MKTYQILYHHLDSAKEGILLEHWRQVFHFFYEHKKTMAKRLSYMSDKGYLKEGKRFASAYHEMEIPDADDVTSGLIFLPESFAIEMV